MGDWNLKNSYVLGLLTLAYVFGEVAHFLIVSTSKYLAQDIEYGDLACMDKEEGDNATRRVSEVVCGDIENNVTCLLQPECTWDYNGQGYEFQILVGPAFVITFSTSMLAMGLLLDNFSRPLIFSLGSLVFSVSCLGMGLSNVYWLLVLLRIGIALGEAVCRPAASSLVSEMFGPGSRATANGIFSLGVYFGYGLNFIFGQYLTEADVLGYGWRVPYVIGGVPGVVIAVLIFFTVKDPRSNSQEGDVAANKLSLKEYLLSLKTAFLQPAMIFLALAAIFRQLAGLSWANNNVNYFSQYFPDTDIGYWLFICSMVGGSSGVLMGGILTDIVQKYLGLHSRLWMQTVFLLLALPFSALTLFLEPPYCFISLMAYYFMSETWFAILFTVITEIVPAETRAFCVAVFMFLMNMVAGNAVIVVQSLGEAIGKREALYAFFPGSLAVSAILFFITSIPLYRQRNKQTEKAYSQEPLIPENGSDEIVY